MCKLFVLSNTAKLTHKQLSTILKTASRVMGKTDSHGFGWAMLNGNRFVGERALDPEYFENRFFNNGTVPSMFKPIFETWEANAFGKLAAPNSLQGGLLVHARISTNQISLENTHPFINDNFALIHNGIIDNVGDNYIQKSTCDTEHALQHLTTGGVEAMVKGISGYYAIGALNKDTGELLVVKDHIADLNACYVPSIDAMAFGTKADQLHEILKAADLAHTKIKAVKDNVAMTFNRKGDLVSCVEITPVEEVKTWDTAAYNASRGFNSDADYDRYEDYMSREGSSNVVSLHGEGPVIPADIARIRSFDDGAPIVNDTFDFVDENGNRIPNWRLDQHFIFISPEGEEISASLFMSLSDEDQEFCEVLDRNTHEVVGRKAS
jgi:hypothetical protein